MRRLKGETEENHVQFRDVQLLICQVQKYLL